MAAATHAHKEAWRKTAFSPSFFFFLLHLHARNFALPFIIPATCSAPPHAGCPAENDIPPPLHCTFLPAPTFPTHMPTHVWQACAFALWHCGYSCITPTPPLPPWFMVDDVVVLDVVRAALLVGRWVVNATTTFLVGVWALIGRLLVSVLLFGWMIVLLHLDACWWWCVYGGLHAFVAASISSCLLHLHIARFLPFARAHTHSQLPYFPFYSQSEWVLRPLFTRCPRLYMPALQCFCCVRCCVCCPCPHLGTCFHVCVSLSSSPCLLLSLSLCLLSPRQWRVICLSPILF